MKLTSEEIEKGIAIEVWGVESLTQLNDNGYVHILRNGDNHKGRILEIEQASNGYVAIKVNYGESKRY